MDHTEHTFSEEGVGDFPLKCPFVMAPLSYPIDP